MMRLIGGHHAQTASYIARVRADGGTIIFPNSLDQFNRWIDAQGLRSFLNVSLDSRWGVKKDGANCVSKLYALEGASKDAVQTTGSFQPIWNPQGMLFDGSDDRLAGIRDDAGTWTMYVSIVHITNVAAKYILAAQRTEISSKALIGVNPDNTVTGSIHDGAALNVLTGGAVSVARHYLAMTYDGTTARLFRDTVADGSLVVSITSDFNPAIKIGCQATEALFYNGYIRTAIFFKTVLTQAQIIALGAI